MARLLNFCFDCARQKLETWQGWPQKGQSIPYLQEIGGENCVDCGSARKVSSDRIYWVNVNGEYSTGLPDYWLLEIDADHWYEKWGRPYLNTVKCKECSSPAIMSEKRFPSGKRRLRCECVTCLTSEAE